MKFAKYVPYPTLKNFDRSWPGKTITRAPRWCSVDLRDGNQALSVPMNVEKKLALFQLLVKMGFKEIEVGFPAASETEFRFVRTLIEGNHIPDSVTIQVLTQGRQNLIECTMDSLRGARSAIVNLYYPTSKVQREMVLGKNTGELLAAIRESVDAIKVLGNTLDGTSVRLEYCPESFMGTELDFALEACHAAMDAWQPSPGNKMIVNLPATVEVSTPNIFADRVEWICRSLRDRDAIMVSVHTHNDRGTAVAAGELAVMAGAERVEGTLFGSGERSGNMDSITMALNLFSQGVDPELDLSDITAVRKVYERCTGIPVPQHHPYAGAGVFATFSGAHQDAVRKALDARAHAPAEAWNIPYLPIDPQDIGRGDEPIVRISSQSGKGGIGYIMKKYFGIDIPAEIQRDFTRHVKIIAEQTGRELAPQDVLEIFKRDYPRYTGVVDKKR